MSQDPKNVRKYWIAAISQDHIQRGVAEGFLQVCHGKKAPLARMKAGDFFAVYSSKISMNGPEPLQAFTAIGQALDDDIFVYEMSPDFHPHRRRIAYLDCQPCPIAPLIAQLDFIQNKKAWGYPFRFGFFEISRKDFNLIAQELQAKAPKANEI